jgi:hypothetical protein
VAIHRTPITKLDTVKPEQPDRRRSDASGGDAARPNAIVPAWNRAIAIATQRSPDHGSRRGRIATTKRLAGS